MMRRHPVSLEIGELVLEGTGLAPRQAAQVRGSVERELTRLIRQGGFPESGMNVAAVRAPALELKPGGGPAEVGRQIARSVYAALGHPR